jgi:hypothetical protein
MFLTHLFYFASGFTTSRAQLMNNCAAGFSVRFFKVTIPIGLGLKENRPWVNVPYPFILLC